MEFINNIQIVNISNEQFIIVFNSKKILNYLNFYQKKYIDYSIELVTNTLYELNNEKSLIYDKHFLTKINNFLSILYLEKNCNNDNINDFLFDDCKSIKTNIKRKIDDDCSKSLSKKSKKNLISSDDIFKDSDDDDIFKDSDDDEIFKDSDDDYIFKDSDDEKDDDEKDDEKDDNKKDDKKDDNKKDDNYVEENKKSFAKFIRNGQTFLKKKLVNMTHIRYFDKNEKKYCGTYYSKFNKIFYDGKYYKFFDFISIGKNEKKYKLTEILKFVEFKIDEKYVKLDIYI